MQITITASTDNHSLFTAVSSAGQVIAERTHSPLLDSARVLLAQSTALSTHALEMWHQGSTAWALRGVIGKLAGLDTRETDRGPKFRRHGGVQQGRACVISSGG